MVEEVLQVPEARSKDPLLARDSLTISGHANGDMAEMQPDKVAAKRKVSAAGAPGQVIHGNITDAKDGTPIVGATVVLPGTQLGVVSDDKGNFQVNTGTATDRLVFSSVGFQTREIKIDPGQNQLHIELPPTPLRRAKRESFDTIGTTALR